MGCLVLCAVVLPHSAAVSPVSGDSDYGNNANIKIITYRRTTGQQNPRDYSQFGFVPWLGVTLCVQYSREGSVIQHSDKKKS